MLNNGKCKVLHIEKVHGSKSMRGIEARKLHEVTDKFWKALVATFVRGRDQAMQDFGSQLKMRKLQACLLLSRQRLMQAIKLKDMTPLQTSQNRPVNQNPF